MGTRNGRRTRLPGLVLAGCAVAAHVTACGGSPAPSWIGLEDAAGKAAEDAAGGAIPQASSSGAGPSEAGRGSPGSESGADATGASSGSSSGSSEAGAGGSSGADAGNSSGSEAGVETGSSWDADSGTGTNDSSSSSSGGDAGSDVTPDVYVHCTPRTCADFPAGTCGLQADGCGGLTPTCIVAPAGPGSLCPAGQYCGGGGPSQCGPIDGGTSADAAPCTPKTCADYPAGTCGAQVDGCGGVTEVCSLTDAGVCPSGEVCGGGGPGLCGPGPDAGRGCVPVTCADLGYPCGTTGDGCGGLLPACRVCPSGQWCGGGGANVCGP